MRDGILTKMFVALVLGLVFAAYAEPGAEDDALIQALNAEIGAIDSASGVDAEEVDVAEPDSGDPVPPVKRAVREQRQTASSEGQQERPRKRPSKDSKVVGVTVIGKGETKEEAKLAAFRAAVEKAVGVWVDAESLMQNNEMLKDRVNTISNADIKKYETIKEGRMKSGLYACQIKALVEKKAITPKFADVFPEAFADVGEEASTIHVQKVTREKRSGDAASMMTAAMEDIDRMRNWVRLSVVKGRGVEEVKKIGDNDVVETPGKGLYSVRYSLRIDHDAYFKGFVPHFKEMLTKMQEGEAEEEVPLTSGPVPDANKSVVMTSVGQYDVPNDLKPFCQHGRIGGTYFVDPVVLSGIPGVAVSGIRGGGGGNASQFMFDEYKGLAKVQEGRTYNIWLIDRMNEDKTVVRCSAYKVPASALRAYWKNLYGALDSSYAMKGHFSEAGLKKYEKVEVVLLDEKKEEIAARIDAIPATLLASGFEFDDLAHRRARTTGDMREVWAGVNVFESFFIRPMFAYRFLNGTGYSSEIQREVYFPLSDSQLEKVKHVKVRFVGEISKRE